VIGHVPLPPYIKRPDTEQDRERYQTVFARDPGSVAAPKFWRSAGRPERRSRRLRCMLAWELFSPCGETNSMRSASRSHRNPLNGCTPRNVLCVWEPLACEQSKVRCWGRTVKQICSSVPAFNSRKPARC
jgi:hypothetical protein